MMLKALSGAIAKIDRAMSSTRTRGDAVAIPPTGNNDVVGTPGLVLAEVRADRLHRWTGVDDVELAL